MERETLSYDDILRERRREEEARRQQCLREQVRLNRLLLAVFFSLLIGVGWVVYTWLFAGRN